MPLFIECPSGHRLKIPSKLAGQSVLCPVCNRSLAVPAKAGAPNPKKSARPPRSVDRNVDAPPRKPRVESFVKKTQVDREERLSLREQVEARAKQESTSKETSPPAAKPFASDPIADNPGVSRIETQRVDAAEANEQPAPIEPPSPKPKSPLGPTEALQSAQDFFDQELPIKDDVQTSDVRHDEVPPPHVAQTKTTANFVPEEKPPQVASPELNPFAVVPPTDHADEPDLVGNQVPATDVSDEEAPSSYDDEAIAVFIDHELAEANYAEVNSNRDQHATVFLLGIASMVVAVLSAIPSILDQFWARQIGIHSPDLWSYIVLMLSVIQIGIAVYAMRLPDWSTAWVAGIVATVSAAAYALGLALTMFAHQEHQLVNSLGLLDEAFRWQAQPWCFFAMCLSLIIAYSFGRFSLRWYQQEQRLAASRF